MEQGFFDAMKSKNRKTNTDSDLKIIKTGKIICIKAKCIIKRL